MITVQKLIYEIDGSRFSNLDEFYDEISRFLIPGIYWGRNLDAFNDILRGGFGTPEDGFVLRWKNFTMSCERLGSAVCDELIEIIRIHCPGGAEEEDGVELILQ